MRTWHFECAKPIGPPPANPIRDRGPGHSKSGYTDAIFTFLAAVNEGLAYSGRPYRALRREASLREHLQEAQELVQTLKDQAERDPAAAQRRAHAAKQRAVRERQERIEAALKQLPEVAAVKKRGKKGQEQEARVSTTDADARVMKMGDGGFRPAYNVQFATTCQEQVIVGMDVVNVGSDMAQMAPMVEQVEQRLGQSPQQWLVDGGFPAHEQLDTVADKTEVYAQVPEPRAKKDDQGQPVQQDKHQCKAGDSEAVAQWR